MRLVALSTLVAVGLVMTAPAVAGEASDTYRDIPAGHWAEQGVAEVSIRRDLMKGYPDGTFRGEQPFTRGQFASSLAVLLRELEEFSGTSWRPADRQLNVFADLAPGAGRDEILVVANEYGLFEGTPGIDENRFKADHTVTRDEMAHVLRRLMDLARALDVVRPRGEGAAASRLKDLDAKDWAYGDILEVSSRYRVMVGFPDDTFRGGQELTRFQYAQAISQTVPQIRQLITETRDLKLEEKRQAEGPFRLQESLPWRFDGLVGAANVTLPGLRVRHVQYPDAWFWMVDARARFRADRLVSERDGGTALDLDLVGGFRLPFIGPVQVQPYAGLRGLATFDSSLPGGIGPAVGNLTYMRFPDSPFALTWKLQGSTLQSTGGWSPWLWGNELGLDVHLSPTLALGAGLSFQDVPSGLASTPLTGFFGGVLTRF